MRSQTWQSGSESERSKIGRKVDAIVGLEMEWFEMIWFEIWLCDTVGSLAIVECEEMGLTRRGCWDDLHAVERRIERLRQKVCARLGDDPYSLLRKRGRVSRLLHSMEGPTPLGRPFIGWRAYFHYRSRGCCTFRLLPFTMLLSFFFLLIFPS